MANQHIFKSRPIYKNFFQLNNGLSLWCYQFYFCLINGTLIWLFKIIPKSICELSHTLSELFSMFLKESCFSDCWKTSLVVPVFKNVRESSTTKNYHPVSLLSVVKKVFEKLVNNRLTDHLKKCALFLISNMVLDLINQLQIIWQLYLIELLGLVTHLGLLRGDLLYARLLTGFGLLVFFTNLSLMEF